MTSRYVTINAFGPIRADVDGTPISLGTRGQRAVLTRLLTARRRVVSTDLLIEDLWAGAPPPRALGALQVHVSNLRRVLEPDRRPRTPASVLVSAPPGYVLNLPDEAVDVWNFERLVGEGEYVDALALWSDGPYRELADTSWASTETTRLSELRRTAVDGLAEASIAAGRFSVAIAELEPTVREHPDREESVRLLALALYRSGRQSDALAVLRRSRDYLADEMGVDPSPALRELESGILSHSIAERHSAAPPPDAPPAEAIDETVRPDNGRPEDLRRLLADADAVRTGGLRLAWIAGEAGEGKTTLASLVTDELARAGWFVGWGRSLEIDGAPPAWAWSETLTALADTAGMDDDDRSRLAPILQNSGPADPTRVQPFWLGKWTADYIARCARLAPTIIVLDDVHRADALTVSILRQLVGDARAERILVVATYRGSEVTEDLTSAWATLVDAPATRLELAGLDREHIASVAARFGLDPLSESGLDLLAERTGGNPLFIRELSKLMASEGHGAARTAVPSGISDVLRRRLTRLPERTLVVLRTLSVLGRGADLDTLLAVTDSDEDELLDDLEPAVLAGLLTEPEPGPVSTDTSTDAAFIDTADRVQFTHALVRDTLYFDLPRLRRRRAHARAFPIVAARFPEDLAAQAHHAALGASSATARTHSAVIAAAARRAETMGSHKEALSLWNSAVDTLDRAPDASPHDRLELLIPLVASSARAANTVDARVRRTEAIAIATATGERRALVEAVTSWRAPVIWHIRGGTADESVLGPVRTLLDDPETSDRERALLLVTSVFEIEGLDSVTASAQAVEAVTIAERLGDPMVLCMALNAFGYLAFGPDHEHERLPRAHRLLAVATEFGLTEYQALAHFQLFLACNAVVDLVGARNHVKQAVAHASGAALTQLLGVLTIFGALVDVLAGRYDTASARYDAVADYMEEQGTTHGFEVRYIGRLAIAIATDRFDAIIDDLPSLDRDLAVRIRIAWALASARTGDMDRAREIWSITEPYQRDYYWRGMTALRAHAAAAVGDLGACQECYDELLPFAGTFAGVDSGSLYCGTVDDALAAAADALGLDIAERHRAAGAELVRTTAALLADPGWVEQS